MGEPKDFKKFFVNVVVAMWAAGILVLFYLGQLEWAIFLAFSFAFSFIGYLAHAAIKGKILVPGATDLMSAKDESRLTGGRARFVSISTAIMFLIPIAIFMEENTLILNNFNLSTFVTVLVGIFFSPIWRIAIYPAEMRSEKCFLERMMGSGK